MAELCALPGTGPSHGYIGQRPEICREASESIVTHTQVPPAWDARMEHRDEQQSLDIFVLPASSCSGTVGPTATQGVGPTATQVTKAELGGEPKAPGS